MGQNSIGVSGRAGDCRSVKLMKCMMSSALIGLWIRSLCGLGVSLAVSYAAAQTTTPKEAQATESGLRKLAGDDARRAEELEKAIEAAQKADLWDEAVAKAEQLVALRSRAHGTKHFETVNAEWKLKTVRRTGAGVERGSSRLSFDI